MGRSFLTMEKKAPDLLLHCCFMQNRQIAAFDRGEPPAFSLPDAVLGGAEKLPKKS